MGKDDVTLYTYNIAEHIVKLVWKNLASGGLVYVTIQDSRWYCEPR